MIPFERSLVNELKDKPFALLGVNLDSQQEGRTRATFKEAVEREGINWRSWWDEAPWSPISKAWGVTGLPTLFLIDAKGVIRARDLHGEDLKRMIDKLIKEAETASP
jgi:hypothetical protein